MWWFTLLIALCSAVVGFAAGQALECLHASPRNLRRARADAYDKGWLDGYDIGRKVDDASPVSVWDEEFEFEPGWDEEVKPEPKPKPKKPKKITAKKPKKAAS